MKHLTFWIWVLLVLSLFLNVFLISKEFMPWFNIQAIASSCEFDECYEDHYVILSTNLEYPEGCQSEGLVDAGENCLLKIDGSNIYVAPESTESTNNMPNADISCLSEDASGACNYCNNLDVAGKSWFLPGSELSGLIDVYNNRSKILGLGQDWYWSSTVYGNDGQDVRWFTRNMDMGDRTRNWNDQQAGVRCISY